MCYAIGALAPPVSNRLHRLLFETFLLGEIEGRISGVLFVYFRGIVWFVFGFKGCRIFDSLLVQNLEQQVRSPCPQ